MTRRLLVLSLAAAGLTAPRAAELPRDGRNARIPHTDTSFRMRTYPSLPEWERRAAVLRKQILTAAGLVPAPARTPLNAQVFGRMERRTNGFSIEKVLLETMPGYYLGGNLYRPLAAGKYPAVLLAHGHDQYGRLEHQHRIHWTIQDEAGQRRENRYPDQVKWAAPISSTPTMAMNLAMQGYVVFTWDMVGYNDTVQTPHEFGGDREKLWSFGPLGLQLWNSTRAADFVQSLPDVDPARIGMTGASGGGSQTFLLAAVDERITAAAPVVMVGGIMQGGSPCENAPGLRWDTFNTELAAVVAPRPLFLVGSSVDQSRNTMSEDYPSIRAVYDLFGMRDRVEAVLYDAPHNYNRYSREAVYRFFQKHLKPPGASGDWTEKAIRLESPNTLLALHGRALPANAIDYGQLFDQWIQRARAAASAMSAAEARNALRATFGIQWPVRASLEGEAVLRREGASDRVPAKLLPGRSGVALVVHENGSAAAEASAVVKRLRERGDTVLMIDAFQTGAAVEPRNFTFDKTRPEQGYHLTFNKSLVVNRVQDIVTALAYLEANWAKPVRLIGLGQSAAVSAQFAAAAVGTPDLVLCADPAGFRGTDAQFIESFFVPGIQRAGGLEQALRLTQGMRAPDCLRLLE